MICFVAFDAKTGVILRTGVAQDEWHAAKGGGALILSEKINVREETHYVDIRTGEIVQKPPKPGQHFEWNQAQLKWIPNSGLAAQTVVLQRNELLAASDWTQLPDVTLNTKEAWATYRQALRDITDQPGFPLNVAWPPEPSN